MRWAGNHSEAGGTTYIRRRYDGMMCIEALSSMRRDAEAAPKYLGKITCDEEEKRLFEKALRWPKEEMKD